MVINMIIIICHWSNIPWKWYEISSDSGGLGKNSGELGVTREYERLMNIIFLCTWFERFKLPALGVKGGKNIIKK